MSSMEINKIVGAVLLVALVMMVFGFIGDGLVKTESGEGTEVKIAEKAPAEKTAKKAAAKKAPIQAIGPLLASANAEKGAVVFKKCAVCHTAVKGGKNKLGPNLWNVVNSPRAGKSGYRYSKAMKKKSGNWTFESLNEFLAKPKAYIPRTKMGFSGIKKPAQRADLIVFLRNLADTPAKLP
jgi:cytochrome c